MTLNRCFSLLLLFGLTFCSNIQADIAITNGSFETGDFTGWIVVDNPSPFEAIEVEANGAPTTFGGFGPNVVIATDGGFAVNHGFDGNAGTIQLSQDVGVVGVNDRVLFDFRAGWDLASFGASQDRVFQLRVETAGGGPTLAAFDLLTAAAGTSTIGTGPNSDSGAQSADISLAAFAGQNVRLSFVWNLPETFSGPANAQLDNVRAVSLASIPEPVGGVALMAATLLVGGLRRRK